MRTLAESGDGDSCWIVQPVMATSAFFPPVESSRTLAVGFWSGPMFPSMSHPLTWRLRTSPPTETIPPCLHS